MSFIKKKLCIKCNHEIQNANYNRHYNSCNGSGPKKNTKPLDFYECKYCGRITKNKQSHCSHSSGCSKRPDIKERLVDRRPKTKEARKNMGWNRGLTKDTDLRVAKSGEKLKETNKFLFENDPEYRAAKIANGSRLGNDREAQEKHKQTLLKKYASGEYEPRKGIGKGKRGWYKGYWCDSSYELAWVIYNLEHDIKFHRNNDGFRYEWNGEIKTFFPDFKLEDGTYVEIKGWMDPKSKIKVEQFPSDKSLKILMPNDLKEIFDYVRSKYSKDFIKLYQ